MKGIGKTVVVLLLCLGLCSCGIEDIVSEGEKQPTKTAQSSANPNVEADENQKEAVVENINARVDELLKNMTLEEKVSQMFIVDMTQLNAVATSGAAVGMDTAESKEKEKSRTKKNKKTKKKNKKEKKKKQINPEQQLTEPVISVMEDYPIGGVFFTEKNIKDVENFGKLISDLQSNVTTGGALYIAVEEEGGGSHSLSSKVSELSDTGYTTQSELGANMTEGLVYDVGKVIAEELVPLGVNLNLAPVADIASENNAEYSLRCFSSDEEIVSGMVAGMVSGMRENGLATTLKYFPGVGQVEGDLQEGIRESDISLQDIRDYNLTTYQAGVDAGTDCIMVSNVIFTKISPDKKPAFMYQDLIQTLLREEIEFDGVVMTPSLQDNAIQSSYEEKEVVVDAVKAGCDMIVLPTDFAASHQALVDAVNAGEIDERAINTSVQRILSNKFQRGIINE